jgi:integrase/recombinase XerD
MQICVMRPHTRIVLDTRRKLKSGKYPVKLRLTFKRKQRYYSTEYELSEVQFEAVMGKSPKRGDKDIRLALDALDQKANEIINRLGAFDYSRFESLLYADDLVYGDVYSYYRKQIEELKKSDQLGTASNYSSSLNSLISFKPELTFAEITVDFLKDYERWMTKKGKSTTTVGIYLRPLRAIINQAIGDGIIGADFVSPFGSKGKKKYKIPEGRNVKKALDRESVNKILAYTPTPGSWEEKAHDLWVFIYLANGINMKDVAYLKTENIDGEFIRFRRAKTRKTSASTLPISIYIQDRMRQIIERQGSESGSRYGGFLFPIIDESDSLEKQRAKIQQMTKMVNKYMKRIASALEIEKDCTTYTARHTFSTVLKRAGFSIQSISEALGHSSITTTKAYLDSFDDESKKEIAKTLLKL